MPNRKQQNIKDMLKKKKQVNNVESCALEIQDSIIPYLKTKNDIVYDEEYTVSTLAKRYFSEHSNINIILHKVLEKTKQPPENGHLYLSRIIKKSIQISTKNLYPFHLFRFNSDYHEIRGKMLLSYPDIKTIEDLEDVDKYLTEYQIGYCLVSVDINNVLNEGETLYKRTHKGNNMPKLGLDATNYSLQRYYESHGLVKLYNLDDITLDELFSISSFEKTVKYIMKKDAETNFDLIARETFDALKDNRSLFFTLPRFHLYPKYKLITNNLTPEQEREAVRTYKNFYECTNAKLLILKYRRDFPISEDLDISQNRLKRRRKFYLMYSRRVNKKDPPYFHNLHWINDIKKSELEIQKNRSIQQPNQSSLWKHNDLKTRNDNKELECPPMTNYDSNNDINITKTNEKRVQRTKIQKNLQEYLKPFSSPEEYKNIVKSLAQQENIIKFIKKDLKKVDQDFYKDNWQKNNINIILHYILEKIIDHDKDFFDLFYECSRELQLELIDKLKIDLYDTSIGNPIATSTQNLNIEKTKTTVSKNQSRKRPFQNSEGSADIITKNDVSLITIPSVATIKQEQLSEVIDSDVILVSQTDEEIQEILDDENVAPNFSKSFEINRTDEYQQNLNVESQNDGLSAEYQLKTIKHKFNDPFTLRQAKKRVDNNNINYLDVSTSDDSGNDKNTNTGNELHQEMNNFSIFLSTQLMYDYVAHLNPTVSMSFTKSWQPISKCITEENCNSGRPCFYLEIKSVIYRKQEILQISINIPQFSLYDVLIKNVECIREIFNLSRPDFCILVKNLSQLESYTYVSDSERYQQCKRFEFTVMKHLDLFFSSISNFKKFNILKISDENFFEGEAISTLAQPQDITNIFQMNMLNNFKKYRR